MLAPRTGETTITPQDKTKSNTTKNKHTSLTKKIHNTKSTPPAHHNHFTALFPRPPGWASARRELLDFTVQGEINRGRHSDHPAGRHSILTNQCPPPPSPHCFTGRMPFLPPNQQCRSTQGNQCIRIREKTLEFSSMVLPAPSPYQKTQKN